MMYTVSIINANMINRTKLGKIKVTLSINFDVYNILLLLLLK